MEKCRSRPAREASTGPRSLPPPARAAPGQTQGRPPALASSLRPPASANQQLCSGGPAHTDPCLPPWCPPHPWCPPRRREELPLISTRADAFLHWLHARPEQRIAVVT